MEPDDLTPEDLQEALSVSDDAACTDPLVAALREEFAKRFPEAPVMIHRGAR